MASVLGKIGLMLFGLAMMVFGGMIALLMIVWEMITHPFTVFKKVPRNGELLDDVTRPKMHGHRDNDQSMSLHWSWIS